MIFFPLVCDVSDQCLRVNGERFLFTVLLCTYLAESILRLKWIFLIHQSPQFFEAFY